MKLWRVDIRLEVVIASDEKPDLLDPGLRRALEDHLSDRLYSDAWVSRVPCISEIPEGWHKNIPYGIDRDTDNVVGDRTCEQVLAEEKA